MRGLDDEAIALGTHLRIGLSSELDGTIALRWDSLLLTSEAFAADLDYVVSESGLTLTADLNGLKCVVRWESTTARVETIPAPELSADFVAWCRHAHMNLVNAHCKLAATATDELASYRILAAATARSPLTPNDAIEHQAASIADLCEKQCFDRLWCTTQPASAMDDVNTPEVTLVYERHLGELNDGQAEVERVISTLIGYRVGLFWRRPTGFSTHHALKLENAREIYKVAR